LVLIDYLLDHGAQVVAHDPEAMPNVAADYGDKVTLCEQPMDTLDNADALAILTEWSQFRTPNFEEIKKRLRSPVIFDGRNLYDPETMQRFGFTYYSIGRPMV
jgi:UDPglucose 6-dehydrogenase